MGIELGWSLFSGDCMNRDYIRDFNDMPEDLQEKVKRGLVEPQEWTKLDIPKGFVEADPGRRLALLRTVCNFSQVELANRAGVRPVDVAIAEGNIGKSSEEILAKITAVLGITVAQLLFHPEAMKE